MESRSSRQRWWYWRICSRVGPSLRMIRPVSLPSNRSTVVPEEVWNYLCGRLRRRTPILSEDRRKQYRVLGLCPRAKGGRHFTYYGGSTCEWCQADLPPFNDKPSSSQEAAPWDLIVYRRYGFGVANPEDPQHWIFKDFPNLPGQHGISTGKENDYAGFSAT